MQGRKGFRHLSKLLVAALLPLSASAFSQVSIQQALDWTEDWQRAKITKGDLLGLTEAKIAQMGQDAWFDYAYAHKKEGELTINGVDGASLVFGAVLAHQNDLLLNAKRASGKARLSKTRRCLQRLVMVAIAIEDTESGGGTYAIHQPRYAVADEESTFRELLTQPRKRKLDAGKALRVIRRELKRRASLKHTFERVLSGKVPVKEDRALGRRGLGQLDELTTLMKGFDGQQVKAIAQLLADYYVDYLYVRREQGGMPWSMPVLEGSQ
jgi:hypothetical protein